MLKSPVVVWICDPKATRDNDSLNEWIFGDELLGLALRRCELLQIQVQTITDEKVTAELEKMTGPIFHFYDPAGCRTGSLSGADARSLSSFSKALEKVWNETFDMSIREFSRKMLKILDKLDKLSDQQSKANQKLKGPALEKKLAKLSESKAKIVEEEKEILDECTLKKKFLADAG